MTEYDEIAASAERIAVQVEAIQLSALRRSMSRDAAVLRGRLLGQEEADRRGESGTDREQRLARAMAYAAWEWDGRPAGWAHLTEFGVRRHELTGANGAHTDFKRGK